MQTFDIIIIGAGPAGGQCARILAKSNPRVLLVEQHEDFSKNDFSSAATPLETLAKFQLPETVVGTYWQKLEIVSTNNSHIWESNAKLGAVFNFAKLREFLANEVKEYGGEVWMGCRYTRHFQEGDKTLVELRKKGGEKITISTKVLIDATGSARAVIGDREALRMQHRHRNKTDFLSASGIEYLIEVSPEIYQQYAQKLVFFLGHKWMPKGYSWIFPMEQNLNRLKVGSARYHLEHKYINPKESIRWYLELLLKDYLKLSPSEYKLIDLHGSTVKYSVGLKDVYYWGNVVAIGDAVSTINMLGGEGIRHGMDNGVIASKYVEKYLDNRLSDFSGYQREMRRRYGFKWNFSERMGRRRYMQDSDVFIDKGVAYLKSLTVEEMMEILFYYRFQKLYKSFWKYLRRKVGQLIWQRILQRT
ncbi:MAG: NAD(P)/FAD-dependent oxidoreductase [Okeania sp. SIO2H7]|nr:NAD(P)/FAD-dependent oxidoreductase [Okeania sp. SIO2H7]